MNRIARSRRARVGMACLLAAIALACFFRVLDFGFAYDDQWTIVRNPALDKSLSFLLRAAFLGSEATAAIADSTRPAMLVSAWIDHRIFGLDAAGHHAHSLVLYALACAVAGLALLALTRKGTIAIAGGAFFAIAPVHAETVAAVNYREDLIAGLAVLGLLAWLFSARFRPESIDAALLAGGAFLVGLLGKESAIALVPLSVGILAVRRPERAWFGERKKTLIVLATVLVLWSAWRLSLRARGVDDVPLAPRSGVWATLLATARYEVQALLGSLAPVAWSPEWDPQAPASALWLLPLAGVLAALIWLARRRSTQPLALGIAVALLAPLVTSPLVGPANERADRFLFLAVLGGALIWGHVADRLVVALRAKKWTLVAVVPLLAPMAVVSQRAASVWKDDLALWTAASERAPNSYRTWVGLSRALRLKGDLDAAESSIERAIALRPDSRSAHVTRAYVRLARGNVEGARADIQKVRDLGGARQRGLRGAERCAALEPEKARDCILGKQ